MGTSHGRALAAIDGFELCGVVTRGSSGATLAAELGGVPHHRDFGETLRSTRPDAVVIASFTETHVPFATQAIEAGCHVFVEKPIAATLEEATALVDLAARHGKVLVVGYILRHHPAWRDFVELARGLGKPLVMRMNLNQQSDGQEWATHQAILGSTSPLVDCGVHYVDVMAQMTGARATRVHAIGARLTDDLPPGVCNYGQLQVTFDDGSIGWYEAGWGPMMSETAFFVKDVIGPDGSASIESGLEAADHRSSDVAAHTTTNRIRRHHAELDDDGRLARRDELLQSEQEPDHDLLCRMEQQWFLDAIDGRVEVGRHLIEVLESMRIVLAADESIRTGRVIEL